ncbi:unnamed protein product [Protopolystoma xenopodis]|uniref:Uncharacterized protein n=1 Tax=Protopolystoma xenopodis TaxID=117903 RepID=A0A3S5BMF4_9PLAT|nr:unnamed protein product [Protopolystoma xenopodis]
MAVMMCTPLSNREVEWSTQLHSALYSKPSQDLSLNISDKMPSSPSRDATNSLSQKQQSMSNRPAVISYNGSSRSSNAYSMHELFFLPSVDSGSVSSAEAKMLTSGSSDSRHNRTAPLANSESSASSASFWHLAPLRSDELTRRLASYRIVSCLVESFGLHSHLINLLTARNADGQTPFMLAIACRAYQVASFIYDVIKKLEADFIGKKVPFNKMDAIFPASNLDDSPLFTLVYNDMCSFTWTGPSHIRQVLIHF